MRRKFRALAGMTRLLTFSAVISILCPSGCSGAQKETNLEGTAEAGQAISALRSAYAAFKRGDMAAAVAPLDAEIEWTEPAEFPGGGTYHRLEAAKHYLTQSRAAWAGVNSEPERFITTGNRIVVFVHARVRAKGSNQ
jgi:ketosteroid isomerase-like protein